MGPLGPVRPGAKASLGFPQLPWGNMNWARAWGGAANTCHACVAAAAKGGPVPNWTSPSRPPINRGEPPSHGCPIDSPLLDPICSCVEKISTSLSLGLFIHIHRKVVPLSPLLRRSRRWSTDGLENRTRGYRWRDHMFDPSGERRRVHPHNRIQRAVWIFYMLHQHILPPVLVWSSRSNLVTNTFIDWSWVVRVEWNFFVSYTWIPTFSSWQPWRRHGGG